MKTFRRERNVLWFEENCGENNNHVVVGKEYYFLSADGYLMPTRKDQPPPDTRYFKTRSKSRANSAILAAAVAPFANSALARR